MSTCCPNATAWLFPCSYNLSLIRTLNCTVENGRSDSHIHSLGVTFFICTPFSHEREEIPSPRMNKLFENPQSIWTVMRVLVVFCFAGAAAAQQGAFVLVNAGHRAIGFDGHFVSLFFFTDLLLGRLDPHYSLAGKFYQSFLAH